MRYHVEIEPQPPHMPQFAWHPRADDPQTWEWYDVYNGHELPGPLGSVRCPHRVGDKWPIGGGTEGVITHITVDYLKMGPGIWAWAYFVSFDGNPAWA